MYIRALNSRFPENLILSHDLLEGCHARAGLISDVQLYEEFPTRYPVDVRPGQRWIRGDWQLIRWLLPLVPGYNNNLEKNSLSWLSKWKLFDNLRRSLVPFALTILFLSCWIFLPEALIWTLSAAGIILNSSYNYFNP